MLHGHSCVHGAKDLSHVAYNEMFDYHDNCVLRGLGCVHGEGAQRESLLILSRPFT